MGYLEELKTVDDVAEQADQPVELVGRVFRRILV